jgi:hypothetical protein
MATRGRTGDAQPAPEEGGAVVGAVPDGAVGLPPVPRRSPVRALAARWTAAAGSGEDGMSTAEYAVGTVAACAFAAVLYRVVTGGSVVTALGELVQSALSTLS